MRSNLDNFPRSHFRPRMIPGVVLIMVIGVFAHCVLPQTPAPAPSPNQVTEPATLLEPDKSVEREVAGGMRHRYEIQLSAGQFMRVEIKPRDINLGVILNLPNGKSRQLFQPFEASRDLVFGEVAEQSGIYRVDIYTMPKATTGHYEIQLVELHQATEKERALQEARDLYFESFRLHKQGLNVQAAPLMIRSLEIREKQLGPDDLLVGITAGILGSIFDDSGDYGNAELLYLRNLKIKEKALGPDHTDVAQLLVNLGSFYKEKGDYVKAEETEQRALQIYEMAQMLDSPFAGGAFENLGDISYEQGDYGNAEKYYERSRLVWEKVLGAEHFHMAPSYTHLGRVAYDAGNYAKAEAMFQKALGLTEKGLGPDHLGLTGYLNDLAMVYCTTGNYAKGESLYQRAISINEQKASMGRTAAQETLFGVARCYAGEGRYVEAVKVESQASEIEEHYVVINLAVGSEREKLAFLNSLSSRLSRNISLHTSLAPDNSAARTLAVTSILERKGRIQDAMSDSFAALRERLSAEDQKLFDQLSETTSRLANTVLNGPGRTTTVEYTKQVKALEEERDNLETEMSRRSAGSYQNSAPVALAAVQTAIPADAALIEFAIYQPFHFRAADTEKAYDKPHYVAYVIRHQGEVQWKELGEASAVDNAVAQWREALRDPRRKDVQQLARKVDQLVMQPLQGFVDDAKLLLISPDGELNLVPFAALVDKAGSYLIQRYSVAYLTSGRDLLRLQIGRQSKSPPVVFANPAFGDPPLISDDREASHRSGGTKPGRSAQIDFSQIFFGPLPGAEEEITALRQLLPKATFLTHEQATKEALESVVAPSILHIATHGFFLSEGDQSLPSASAPGSTRGINAHAKIQNPLLRSGLALAGANRRDETGILTALEASGLNLWGTKLVVLSACDTGVGEIRNGEGVYGLRRALVLAGAESQLMTLWAVPDRATRDLMIGYYHDLVNGYGRSDALRRAQLQVLQTKARNHPYYWASFIQTGEWANLDGKR